MTGSGVGGIVWTLASRGVIHEELPADANRELHGLQILVNLSSKNKLATPPEIGHLTLQERIELLDHLWQIWLEVATRDSEISSQARTPACSPKI